MLYYSLFLLEQTVWFPILIGLLRYRSVRPVYLPLLLYLLSRALCELLGNLVSIYHLLPSNAFFYNLMYLLEAVLVTWQLANLKVFAAKSRIHLLVQVCWILLWVAEMCRPGALHRFSFVFHTTYSFILLFLATALIGRQAADVKQRILRNAAFLFGASMSIWFMYNVFYAIAIYLFPQIQSLFSISTKVIIFIEISEAVFYLSLAWAIHCIPLKRNMEVFNYFS